MKTTSISSILVFLLLLVSTHTLQAQSKSDTYHLILGSYVTFDLADQKIKELARSGYDAIVIFPNDKKKRYRVSVYHSANRNEVVAYNKLIQSQGVNDGWIYTEKPPQPKKVVSTSTTQTSAPSPFRNVAPRSTTPIQDRGIDPNITYHLIVGTFADALAADNYARELEGEGFEAVILNPDKVSKKFRVSIYFTKNKREIDAYASSVRRQGKVKGWVYAEHLRDGTEVVSASKKILALPTQTNMSYLVIASFASHIDATEHAAKLSKAGVSPTILMPRVGETARYRISIYQSPNRADVVTYQRQLKNKGQEAGWILN